MKKALLELFQKVYIKLVIGFAFAMFCYGLGKSLPKEIRLFFKDSEKEEKNSKNQ